MTPTGWQIREARRLAGMSQIKLALAAGVGLELVARAELADDMPMLTRLEFAVIQQALEAAGLEFNREDGGTGVQLREVDP